MLVLQVIDPDEQSVEYYRVKAGSEELVRNVDGERFNSDAANVEAFVKACGGDTKFNPGKIGDLTNSPVGATEFCIFWYDS